MPNASSNQLVTPTTHNHDTTAATQSMQSNQYDEYSSQSQYGNQRNFTGQQFNNYNQNYNPSYWKEGSNFYRGDSDYYQPNQSSETKSQYPYPQDPRLEVGEIRMVKSEPNYQNFEETNYNGANDQNLYQNHGFNEDNPTQGVQQSEQPIHNQGFSPDVQKVTQSNFTNTNDQNIYQSHVFNEDSTQGMQKSEQSLHNLGFSPDVQKATQGSFPSQGSNQETVPCQNISRLQSENISEQMNMSKPKSKNVRNRKPVVNNKQIPKNQPITTMTNSRVHVDNNCNNNENNLTNQQAVSCNKELSFSQAFGQSNSQETHSNSNQGLFANNQNILTSSNKGIFGSSARSDEDIQFNNNHTSLSESSKGIYGNNLLKQGNENSNTDLAVSFEGIFDNSRMMSNSQKSNLNQCAQNSIQTSISSQDINNSLSNNQSIQNQVTNCQIIDDSQIMSNSSANSGMMMCDSNNQGQLPSSQGTVQHSLSRSVSHDRSLLSGHQEIEQKFVNQQQQLQQHQQHHHSQEQQYSSSDNLLSNCGQIPIREPYINPNSTNNSYNNYMLESNQHLTNQNQNYGAMLPDSSFQSQNILNDQMLHDQEMLLANDQAMLSVLNSTTDANEQALLYSAMVGQPDGQGLLGLLEPPSMMNNQINEYPPVYGPLPPSVKPGLPGGAKTNPESNQYTRSPSIQNMTGRGAGSLPGAHNQNEVKMYPEPNRFNVSNSNESYSRYSNYSPMYPPYTPSSNTPLGSISDILDNIPGPERTYQPPERKNPAPCTMTSQDINPLPPFRSLDNKTKYEYGSNCANSDIDQSQGEKSSFSINKESKSLDDTIDSKLLALEEGEIKNPSLFIKSGKEEPGIPYDWVRFFNN